MKNGALVTVYQAVPVKIMIRILFFLAVLVGSANAQNQLEFGNIEISVNQIALNVEYANTPQLRNRGLMFRKSLCDDCGMLFRFSSPKPASMWMKNTYVPLDVAFVKASGEISDIKQMEPHDLTPVGASQNVLFALEMNQGWFADKGIKVGDRLEIASKQ